MIFALLGLIVLVALILIARPFGRAKCRWEPDPRKLADGRQLWSCAACGATEAGRRPPVACIGGRT